MATSLILKPRAKFESFGGVNFAPPPKFAYRPKRPRKIFKQQTDADINLRKPPNWARAPSNTHGSWTS